MQAGAGDQEQRAEVRVGLTIGRPSGADYGQPVVLRLKDCPVVVDLHEFGTARSMSVIRTGSTDGSQLFFAFF